MKNCLVRWQLAEKATLAPFATHLITQRPMYAMAATKSFPMEGMCSTSDNVDSSARVCEFFYSPSGCYRKVCKYRHICSNCSSPKHMVTDHLCHRFKAVANQPTTADAPKPPQSAWPAGYHPTSQPPPCPTKQQPAASPTSQDNTLSPVDNEQLTREFKLHPDRFVDHLIDRLLGGFDTGIHPVPQDKFECMNNQSAINDPDFVTSELEREVERGFMKGPFNEPPFANYTIGPLSVAMQAQV